MAEEVVTIELLIENAEGAKTVGELKKAVKDLQNAAIEAEKSGNKMLSEQFFTAAAKAKGELRDIKEKINALDPEKKAAAFGTLTRTIAGGFEAATGAAALFGTKSEEVEKTLLKVQAAMAFARGIQDLSEFGKAWDVLKTTLLANPIFIIGSILAAIGVAIYELKDKFKVFGAIVDGVKAIFDGFIQVVHDVTDGLGLTSEAERQLAEDMEKTTEQIKLRNETLLESEKLQNAYINLLKAQGKSEQEIFKAEYNNALNKRLQLQQNYRDQALILKNMTDKTSEEYKKQVKAVNDAYDDMTVAILNHEALVAQHATTELKKTTDHQEALKNIRVEKTKEYLAEEIDVNREAIPDLVQLESDKLDAIFEVSDEARAKHKSQLEAEEKQEAQRKLQTEQNYFNASKALSDALFNIRLGNVKKGSEEEKKIKKQQFEVNKAVSVAEATINGIQSVTKTLAEGGAFAIPLAVSMGVLSLANIAKILSVKFDGGSGGNFTGGSLGGNAGNFGGGPQINPVVPSNNSTILDANGRPVNHDTPIVKAYVVESEMTQTQKHISSIQSKSTF